MKNKLSVALSVLVCAVLVFAALGIGAVKGWKQERAEVVTALNQGGELYSLRQTRAMDALNLCALAQRHQLSDDADIQALRNGARVLTGKSDLQAILAADNDISAAAARLEAKFKGLDDREKNYLSALVDALSPANGLNSRYTAISEDFNDRFASSLMGKLAAMLGVDPVSGAPADTCDAAKIAPRYPKQDGYATDAARILSGTTLEDLGTVDKRLDKADVLRLKIATVDFLDGQDAEAYADALFQRWDLDDEDVLLLLAVGSGECAISAGSDAARKLTPAIQEELLQQHVKPVLDKTDYEDAVVDFTLAFVSEVNRLYGKRISTAGLFGKSASGMFDGIDQLDFGLADNDGGSFFTREDKGTGFSFLKVVLIVVVLLVVFGSRSQKTRSRAAGIASKVKNRFSKS